MDRKIPTVCLMNSRRIQLTLSELAQQRDITTDRHMAVVAALKLLKPAYQGAPVNVIYDDLSAKNEDELLPLARLVHPVLCSLKLEKWLRDSGHCQYLAQRASPRGEVVRRILLDEKAGEILQSEGDHEAKLWN